jgi:hypothetical protein
MENITRILCHRWIIVITIMSLTMLELIGIASVRAQTGSGTICVLQVAADGDVLSVLVDQTQNFNVAVLVPSGKKVNVPITCESLATLGLGVSNQKNNNVNFAAQVLTHDGEVICTKGPYQLNVNGGRGVIFSDCPGV